MKKKWFIFIVLIGIASSLRAQSFTTAITINSNDNAVQQIQIDFSKSFYYTTLVNTAQYKSINHLIFSNSDETPINGISLSSFDAEQINILEFDNLSQIDFKQVVVLFRNLKSLNTLVFRNTKINSIPMELVLTKGVKTLIIENCKTLNPLSLNSIFYERSNVRTLRLINCDIYSLNNIFPRNNFNVIDLRNNHLASAGSKLSSIKMLDSVFLSGNNIPDAKNDLMFFSKSHLAFVEADSISIIDHRALREANKNIHWKFISQPISQKTEAKKVFGQFVVNSSKYKVYSSAYLQYDRLFSNSQFSVTLDTASLDEVFWDTLNRLSQQIPTSINRNIFKLFKEKNLVRKHITFGFNKNKGLFSSYSSYSKTWFYKNHGELSLFKKYHWVTVEPMNSKKFRQYSRKIFTDLRLIYNGVGVYYTLYLKQLNGKIIVLKVYPVKGSGKKKSKNNTEKYANDYSRYLLSLARKSRKHDRNILKNKRKIYVSIEQYKRNSWNTLRSYMSPIEREMSKEEWMEYYFEIVRYEEIALLAAYPSSSFIDRKLRKMGFDYQRQFIDTATIQTIFIYFTDDDGANIPVNKVLIINKSRMTFKTLFNTTTLGSIALTLPKDDDIALLVYLPDGSVGMATIEEIEPCLSNSINTRIKSQVVDSSLITIAQIMKTFSL